MRTQTRRLGALQALWAWLTVLMLVLAMAGTAISPASAQGEGEGEEPGTEQVETPEEPNEPDEPEEPDDPGGAGESPENGEEAPEADDGGMEAQQSPTSWTNRYLICPPGADLVNGDPGALEAACTLTGVDVLFTLIQGTNTTPLPVNQPGAYGFFYPLPGEATVTLIPVPPAFAVFCEAYDDHGNTKPYARALVASPSVTLDVADGERIACTWFIGVEDTGNALALYKFFCLPGVDPTVNTVDCAPDDMQEVDFTLADGKGTTPFKTGATVPELTGIEPDAGGAFTVTETIPSGYGVPVVFCQNNAEDPPATAPTQMPVTNGSIKITPSTAEFDYDCFWYNVPADDPGSVIIYKWECPNGTDATRQDHAYYSAECATEQPGVAFTLTDGNGTTPFTSDTNGRQLSDVVPDANGAFTLTETIPAGFGMPAVFCQDNAEEPQPNAPTRVSSAGGVVTLTPGAASFEYQCFWYNLPEDPGTVIIHKWECPQGQAIDPTLPAHQAACTQAMDGVTFTLADGMGARSMTTSGGVVEWPDVPVGVFTVTETVPPGYSTQPYVACEFESENNLPLSYSVINNVLTATLNHDGQVIVCHWFNQYEGPGEIIVHKWTCPEGYDRTAWGADPKSDCPEATNGVTFVLNQPSGVDLQTDTGDSIDGAVRFGGLDPGDYVLNEIVPPGISEIFVLDCTGLNTGAVHPVPLSVGPVLPMRVAAGDMVRCNWYNVPEPTHGWLTVIKYACWTETYVRDLDCEIYEGGKDFELQVWLGGAWTKVATGTTGKDGRVTWTNLGPGNYRVVELDGKACKIVANPADNVGNAVIKAKAGTVVKVYNCGVPPQVKKPTTYPVTGADPSAPTDAAPGVSILGALGLAGTAMSRRAFLRRSLLGGAAAGALGARPGSAGQVIEPDATSGADCLYPATPESATDGAGTPVACGRGAVPVRIAIEAIGVDAEIEVLEIIAGEMEQPTGAEDVAWYKGSARLGERGNILLAGHLNWWGEPQAVFFLLRHLREGDVVELLGEDDETYRYIVQWTEDFPSDAEPPEEALGQAGEEAITMITCGGEWITDRSEYDHRTLVRAIRNRA